MTATHQQVTEALRNELQQYGELLARLEAQGEIVSHREAPSVLGSINSIDAQSLSIEAARLSREKLQGKLAWSLGRPDGDSLDQLIPLLPPDHRPLIEALALEINNLNDRAHAQASLNLAQLERSLILMKRFTSTLSSRAKSAMLVDESIKSCADAAQCPSPAVTV